jgi:Relaxase/Mobilisation nuclease domain
LNKIRHRAYHTVISFHDKDREYINKGMLKDIAKEYMKQKGEDIMYIATAHYDQEHIHIHIAESGTKYMTGVANRMSKDDFTKLKAAMATYQKEKYPELVHSTPTHGTKEKMVDTRATQKATLSTLLNDGYRQAKSQKEFLTYLQSKGHTPYYRGGVLTGIKYDGERKFRLSKLGYDKEKLEVLSMREDEHKELLALHELRESGSAKERESTGRVMEDEYQYEEGTIDMEEDEMDA